MPQDITLIRINVDDFDEAYKYFTERGFTLPQGGKVVETETNKSVMLCSPSGFAFDLCHHIKDKGLTSDGFLHGAHVPVFTVFSVMNSLQVSLRKKRG